MVDPSFLATCIAAGIPAATLRDPAVRKRTFRLLDWSLDAFGNRRKDE
jgi:hypothetical protein